MNCRKTLTMIMAISLILGSCQIFAQTAEELFPKGIQLEEVKGELEKAIEVYQTIVTKFSANRPIAAKAQFHIGLCYEKSGLKQAQQAYQKVLDNYSEQTDMVALAKAKLATLCSSGATGDTEVTMRRILATKNQPVGISHDGRYVIINLYESGDLWLHDLQSGEQRQITREASGVDWTFATGAAAISPDGKQIAYDWQAKSYGELRLSALDGSSMRVLHNGQDGRRMSVSDWMPDGRKMLAVSYDLKSFVCQLHIISLPDGTIRDIGQPDSLYIIRVRPSPNGRYIAYSRGQTGDIFIYDTATEHESVFVQNPAINALAGWTPDGSGIVFVSNRSGTHDLYLLGIENGKPRGDLQLLRKDFGANAGISLTHDGRLFRIENMVTCDSYIVPVNEKTGKITGMPSLVEPNYPNAAYPDWSPDGKLLYYQIFKESPNEPLLFIRSEVTGQTREITLKPKFPYWYRPILSPDGQRFAVTGTDKNMNFGVFAIDLESGDVSQLARIVENVPVDPSQNWSPDGKAIFYKVRSLEKSEEFIIRRKDLTTGEEKDVHRGIHTRFMKISSDGNRFVYFRHDRPTKSYVLGILDIQSGKELELWRIQEADTYDISGPRWTPDERHVLVARHLKQGTELWRFPATGGPGEKLHLFPDERSEFVLHPSGKQMAYTQIKINYELWVLENFLPETETKK